MDGRPWVLIAAFVIVLAATFAVALSLPVSSPSSRPTIIRGIGTASDGRISITIDGWLMANNNYTEFSGDGLSSSVYLLVLNLTITNVGHGNASIPGIMFATVSEDGRNVSNTWMGGHSNRTGELPTGGNLFPATSVTGWWAFYMPGAPPARPS